MSMPSTVATATTGATWMPVCRIERVLHDTGITALVGTAQVAVFRLHDERVYALGDHDPCSGANVLSRGIVGDVAGRPFVASPVHKQRFDLQTGECLDADGVRADLHRVRVVDGVVEVALGAPAA